MSLTDEINTDFSKISKSNFNRVYNSVSKVGYSDGITDGRESVFQKGFDCGYENGFLTGFELAKYKAFFGMINKNTAPLDNIHMESSVYQNLNIPDPKDKSHFKINEQPDGKLTEIFIKQVNYVNQQKALFARELPVVTNLLSQ